MKPEWHIYKKYDLYRIGRKRWWGLIEWYKENEDNGGSLWWTVITDSPRVAVDYLARAENERHLKIERKKETWKIYSVDDNIN